MLQLVDISPVPIDDYRDIVGEPVVERLRELTRALRGVRILQINATPYGGGVSEMLRSVIAIERGLGLDVEWRVIAGDTEFFEVTKRIHNGLQGDPAGISAEDQRVFLDHNRLNAEALQGEYDVVIVHDPQPAALLAFHGHGGAAWIWRCHIDTSHPNSDVLGFVTPFLDGYDALVFTMDEFVPAALRDRHIHLIPPAIDPLSPKNLDLSDWLCRRILSWAGVDPNRPLLTQVSRFDPWKDPLGVIRVYRLARNRVPGLQLALLGSMATDDPEAWDLLQQVRDAAGDDPDITIGTNLTGISNIEVNAFQRASDVVIQKSIREGFGLIVSETLWKGTSVVAGRTGGIPMQMPAAGERFLIEPTDDAAFAERVVELLRDRPLAISIGEQGHELVRDRFLMTRLVMDELQLIAELRQPTSLAAG
ncbi:MAG TPA: glycosyltransferase [Thermomicrobiales bacterium]|nr:glycosyltransferase [Thermomicrobiales bacterium]